ncbi:MAG: ABC transporter substrate-binding protein, partial [Dehalococcoidia bacterium]|nr:ABC transporter substrate-binding protein [Dehalococcoidia bacterium]
DGILRLRQTAPWSSINPWKGLDSGLTWGFYVFDHLFYTPLDTLKPELFLATSLEQPEPTRIIFKLGEGYFHDKPPVNGRRVTARDVKASYETSIKQPGVSTTTFMTQVFAGIDVPDDETVIVKLNAPDAWAFTSTALGGVITGSIIPEEICAQPDFMDRDIIGSGRFVFEGHESGTNFRLRRFEKWRVPGEPWLAGMRWFLIQEQAQALAAFSAQDIDTVGLANVLERDQLVQRHGKDIEIDSDLSRSVWVILTRADGRWADRRARKAVNLAIDRDEIIEVMTFGEGVKSGVMPPAFASVSLSEQELSQTLWKFDPAQAKQLLAQAGFDTTQPIEIKVAALGDNFSKFAQAVAAQLEKNLGVKTNIVTEDFGTWLQKSLYGSEYKDLIVFPTLAYDEPTPYLLPYQKDIGGRPNWARFFDDELDQMIARARTIMDDEQRFEALKEVQRKAIEKVAPLFPVYVPRSFAAYWYWVKGRITGRGSYGLFNGRVYIDKRR